MVEKKRVNRIHINLSTCDFEVESSDSSLKEVFTIANIIAAHIGTPGGLKGKSWDERVSDAGIV